MIPLSINNKRNRLLLKNILVKHKILDKPVFVIKSNKDNIFFLSYTVQHFIITSPSASKTHGIPYAIYNILPIVMNLNVFTKIRF